MFARKSCFSADRLWFPLAFLIFTACASHTVKFVHPESGATAECSASGIGIGASFSEGVVGGCARSYESRGYLRTDQLTAAQRADLEQRGYLPKD